MDIATLQQRLNAFDANVDGMETHFGNLLESIDWTQEALLRYHHHEPSSKSTKAKCETANNHDHDADTEPDFRSRQQKLDDYVQTVDRLGHFTEPELIVSAATTVEEAAASTASSSSSSSSGKRKPDSNNLVTFAEITSRQQRRDQKRRRQKYRTTKAPPLRLGEELRALIAVQMDAWCEYVQRSSAPKRHRRNHSTQTVICRKRR